MSADVNQEQEVSTTETKPATEQPQQQAASSEVAELSKTVESLRGIVGSMTGTIKDLQGQVVASQAPEAKAKSAGGEQSSDNPALAVEVQKLKEQQATWEKRDAAQKQSAKGLEVKKAFEANGLDVNFADAFSAKWAGSLKVADDLTVSYEDIPGMGKTLNEHVAAFALSDIAAAIKVTPKVPGTKGVHGSAPKSEGGIEKVDAQSDRFKQLTNEELRSGKFDIQY